MSTSDWLTQKPMPISKISQRRTRVIGHRGGAGLAPENTMAAFRNAATLGIDGIECDVMLSADGHIIVYHDDDLSRLTNGTGISFEKTLAALKKLDAGAKFDSKFAGERIPVLSEVFDFMQGNDLLLFLELKSPLRFPGIEQQVVDLIHEYDYMDRILVQSFYHDSLDIVHTIAPEISIAELWLDRIPAADESRFRTINPLFTFYTPEIIEEVHARGQQTAAWTVNDMEAARQLIAAGIDAITTDYPDQVVGLFSNES